MQPITPFKKLSYITVVLITILALAIPASSVFAAPIPSSAWRFENNYLDSVGANHGTASGGPTFSSTDKKDGTYSLILDGVNDYVNMPFPAVTAYTISMWIKPVSIGTAQNIFVFTDASGPTISWSNQLRLRADGKLEHYLWDGSGRIVTGTTTLSAGTWYFVTISSSNSGSMKLYLNGVPEGGSTAVGTMWALGNRYRLGQNSTGFGYFNGLVDNVRIHNFQMTDAEALALVDPVLTINPTDLSVNENIILTIDPTATITDAGSSDYDTGTLTIEETVFPAGTENISFTVGTTTGGSFTRTGTVDGSTVSFDPTGPTLPYVIGSFTGYNTPKLTFTFTANATPALVQLLTQRVRFQEPDQTPDAPLTRVVLFTLTDGDGGTATDSVNITVLPLNDQPNITNISGTTAGVPWYDTVTWTESNPPLPVYVDAGQNATTGDVDSPDFDAGTLTITITNGEAGDVLTAQNYTTLIKIVGTDVQRLISGLYVSIGTITSDGIYPNPLVITFNASALPAYAGNIIRGVGYHSTSDAPDAVNSQRVLTYVLYDGDANTPPDDGTSVTRTSYVNISATNDAPAITSDGGGATAAINVAEEQTAVTTVTATDADLPAQTLTYSIIGGADQLLFGIDGTSGVLTFNSPPDFETPGDADTNNIYEVTVQVDDGSLTDNQDISVTVTDANDAPTDIALDNNTVDENLAAGALVGNLTTTDPDPADTHSYSFCGGTDDASFQFSGAQLQTNAVFDFETKSSYSICVRTTDSGTGALSYDETFTINVNDLDEIRPTVTVEQGAGGPQADPTNTLPIVFDVVFSEDVTGFDATDLTFGGTAIPTAATVTMIDFHTYTVNVTTVTNNGTVIVSIDENKAHDAMLNGNEASDSLDNEVTYDTDEPAVTKVDSVNPTADNEIAEGESTNVSITQLLVTFDEDMDETLAETLANYELTKDGLPYPITGAAYDNSTFTVALDVAALPDGAYKLTVKTAVEDLAGTPMNADFVRNFIINTVTPNVVKIDSAETTADNTITQNEITNVAIKKLLVVFDKDLNEAQAEDLANYELLKDGAAYTINSATYDAGTFTVTLNVSAPVAPKELPTGDYQLTIKAGIEDISGNPLLTAFVRRFEVDLSAPFVVNKGVDTNQSTEGSFLMDGEVTDVKIFLIKVKFSEEVYNPAGDTEDDDVTNVDNYALVRNGKEKIKINKATYNPGGQYPKTVFLEINNGLPLPNGSYTLVVSGTNTIVDLGGTPLAGDGSSVGTDFALDFTVFREKLPNTGFAPNMTTILPEQPASLAYSALGDLWIEVPSLGIKSTIVGIPVSNKGWDTTWLWDQVGYLQGTAYPTLPGNTVITGHVTTADGKTGPFAYIKNLKYGDQVIVHFGGQKFTYEVRTTSLVSPLNRTWLTRSESYSWLTMITCQSYNEKTGEYLYRRIVRAVLVGVEADQ